jgi:hypothetical protein
VRTTLFPDKKQKSVTARFGRGFENAEREIGETGRRDARVAGRRRRVRRTHHAGGVDGGLQLLHGEGHEGLRATLAALLREMRGDRRRVCECPESLKPATRAFDPSRVPSRGLTDENARVARARRTRASRGIGRAVDANEPGHRLPSGSVAGVRRDGSSVFRVYAPRHPQRHRPRRWHHRRGWAGNRPARRTEKRCRRILRTSCSKNELCVRSALKYDARERSPLDVGTLGNLEGV